ncbi:MAG: signal peptidase I [Ruminococcus sp.]|nr:signal peptidase I [Ruminococcus sp.]
MNENEENIAEETAAPVTGGEAEEKETDSAGDKPLQEAQESADGKDVETRQEDSEEPDGTDAETEEVTPDDTDDKTPEPEDTDDKEPEPENTDDKEPVEDSGEEEPDKKPEEPDDKPEESADKDDEGGEDEPGSLFSRITNGLAVAILVAATIFTAYVMINTGLGKPVNVFGRYVLRVMTGSMEPSLHTGDYIVVKKVDTKSIKKDDVITFYSEESDVNGKLVTHRVVDIEKDGSFQTMGDANPVADHKLVRPDQVVGKYVRKARFFRWVSSFADSKKILLVLVIIPLTLIAFYEMKTVVKLGIKAKLEDKEDYEQRKQELMREAIEKEKQRLAEEAANNSDKEISHEPRETNEKEND